MQPDFGQARGTVRRRFGDMNCSVAQALEVLGDWWTLLIIREAFLGTTRFADFEANLGISKNVLNQHLRQLVDHGVLETVEAGRYGTRLEYRLGPSGKDLVTIITALRQWGDRWVQGAGHEPLRVLDRRTGRPIPPVRLRGEDGRELTGRDLLLAPGPGADEQTRERFERQPG
jgi:DNA-binding HxlR family transcriptional regulator